MKYLVFCSTLFFALHGYAQNYTTSDMDAVYLATLKAVVDYKINDAETLKQIEKLRQDEKFDKKLRKMLGELNNQKRKNAQNKRIFDVLKTTGKKIYNELN